MEIAGYETLTLLGSGQYGDVLLVRSARDGQLYAAKVVRSSREGPKREAVEALRKEAELLASLRHCNVVRCIDIIQSSLQLVIIMEYAAGGDLDTFLRMSDQR
jgi:serine/threonine protein kinase